MGFNDKDEFDDLLDGALKRYGEAEPRAGIEGRVLARITESRVRRNKAWVWALGAAAVSCLVITIALVGNQFWTKAPTVRRNPIAAVAHKSDELASATVPAHRQESSIRRHHHSLQVRTNVPFLAADTPRLDRFPSPQPLSEQERLLKMYVTNFPQQAALIARQQSAWEKELADQGWKNSVDSDSN